MKHVKIIGIAATLAVGILLASGLQSAIAAKTCSTSGTGAGCAAGHGNELTTQAFSANSEGQNWLFTSGFITIRCEAPVSGEFTHEGKGRITSWTFSNCTSNLGECANWATTASSANPYLFTSTATGSGNGSLAITANPVTMQQTCAGVTCKYTTNEMGGKNGAITVTGGEPGKMTWTSIAAMKEEGSSGFCSSSATWEGTFSFSSPTSLWIE